MTYWENGHRNRRSTGAHLFMSRPLRLFVVFSMLLTAWTGFGFESARAANTPFVITQTNPLTFEDGPAGTELICACYTDRDLIRVVRLDGDEDVSPNLDQESDFDGTLWMFDVGQQGRGYQLAVRFFRENGLLTANIYHDQNEDGFVSIGGSDSEPVVTEPGTWAVQAIALDGYWQRDGRLAGNLDILVDDKLAGSFGSENYIKSMVNDSVVDTTIRVRGPTETDPRSYEWRDVTVPVPPTDGILRTTLMIRESGLEPAIAPVFPWLLLGYATDSASSDDDEADAGTRIEPRDGIDPQFTGFDHPYGENAPPIQVNWNVGRISLIGEIISSRWSDTNWFTYSINRIEPGTVTELNFESPFNFYDLAGDEDGIPELMVRIERMVEGDHTIQNPSWEAKDIQKIRYVWDQQNTQDWSFKLGLLGQHQIEQLVPFQEFTLETVPYDDLPGWATQNKWDIATFVAAERDMWTTEGIYDWDPSGTVRDTYYAGLSQGVGSFNGINSGMRGDYRLDLKDQPWLTFNPIDGKLHLYRAEAGVWDLGGGQEIRYGTTDLTFFDSWVLYDNEVIVQELHRVPGGLLFSDAGGTWFREVDVPHETFRVLPPTNTEEWNELGELLNQNKIEGEPGDLRAYFDQFDTEAIQIADQQAIDIHRTGTDEIAFSFEGTSGESYPELEALSGQSVEPGAVLVTLNDAGWATMPGIYRNPEITLEIQSAVENAAVETMVRIYNPGTFAISGLNLNVALKEPDELDPKDVRLFQNVEIAGGDVLELPITWRASSVGENFLLVDLVRNSQGLRDPVPVTLATYSQAVMVEPSTPIPLDQSASISSATSLGGRAIGIMLLASLATVIAVGVLRPRGSVA